MIAYLIGIELDQKQDWQQCEAYTLPRSVEPRSRPAIITADLETLLPRFARMLTANGVNAVGH